MKILLVVAVCMFLIGCDDEGDRELIARLHRLEQRELAASRITVGDILPDSLKFALTSMTTTRARYNVGLYHFTIRDNRVVAIWVNRTGEYVSDPPTGTLE